MSATFPSQMVHSAVACALSRSALESEITLRPAAPHQSNRLYDVYVEGAHLIAKEYLRADRPEAAHHEYAALRHVESLQLAPEPVFFDPDVGPVVVYHYMEGEMWDRRVPSASELADLALMWLRFHPLRTDGLWMCSGQARPWPDVVAGLRTAMEAYACWADRSSSQSRAAARVCLEALERCVAAAAPLMATNTPPLCFCRSDPRFANVIARSDGGIGLVDWEDCGLRDPAREVADLLMHPNQEDLLDFAAWQPFLSVYRTGRRDDPDFELRLQAYLALFPVFWLGFEFTSVELRTVELAAVLVQCCLLPAERHNVDAWPLLEGFLQAHVRTSELLGRAWTTGELRAIPDLIRYRQLVVFRHWHGRWRSGISALAAAAHQLQQILQLDVWLTRQSDRLVSMLLSTAT